MYLCKYCKKEHTKKGRTFCCKDCYTKWQLSDKNPNRKRVTKPCKECGEEFTIPNYVQKNNNQQYCSRKCAAPNIVRKKGTNKIVKECETCLNPFKVFPYRKNARFCSRKCKHDAGRKEVECPVCDTLFTTTNWRDIRACSKPCTDKLVKITNKFEDVVYEHLLEHFDSDDIQTQISLHYDGGYYRVDFLIYDTIIIECNGDYWHCNPIRFEPEYYHKQIDKLAKDIWKRDNDKLEVLSKLGYKVYVLWENYHNEEYGLTIKEIINEIR